MAVRLGVALNTTRVSTRLVAIVLVPLIGIAASVRAEAQTRWRIADEAQDLKTHVQQVSTSLPLGLLLSREVFLVGAQTVGKDRGLTPAQVDALLGLDVRAELSKLWADMRTRFAALPPGDPLARYAAPVESIRRLAIADALTPEVTGRLGDISTAVNAAAFNALSDVEEQSLGYDGASRADRALGVLRAANGAASAAFDQMSALARLVASQDPDPQRRLEELRVALAEGDAAERDLSRLATGEVADSLDRLQSAPQQRVSKAQLEDIARGDLAAVPAFTPVELAATFARGMDRLAAYYGVVDRAAADAADAAQHARDHAIARLRATLLATAALFSATLLITALIARSIARPLRRLAAGADRVRAGQLDTPLPRRGPRELAALTDTLEEVVGNLRLVEAHVGALAAGELEHPALRERVPGRLGRLLHDSVTRLSRSMFEKEELSARLRHEANHDALTGLPNRSAAARHLDALLAISAETGTPLAVLYVDLDGFKQVNDAYGHDAGDAVLKVAASRLVRTVRSADLVARIGGDEFLVVAPGISDARELQALGERLIAEVSAPVAVGSVTMRVGASVGIAFSPDGSADPDSLLRDADLAGYEAKDAGRGRVELFDEELRGELRRADEIGRALREALAGDELELHYQPVFGAHDPSRPIAVEALLRWNRAGLGYVPPSEFIPIAETSDLVVDLDRWVLDRACAQLAAWADEPRLRSLPIAVNLSGRHLLNLTCVDDVRAALERHDVAPSRLTVEITETVLLADVALIADHLAALRRLGVRVAIDDFGTGYTSLTHLSALPADVLKIDMSLVAAATSPAPQAEVVALLIGTAHALGLSVTAEGVETEVQHERMRTLGCDEVQGFHLARPMPAAALRTLVLDVEPAAVARP